MCAQFGIVTDAQLLNHHYGVKVPENLQGLFKQRFLPYQTSPILVSGKEGLELKPMNFSLVPSWSKTPRVKFATHNARLETIAEKPTWKRPFQERRCLVPMNYFVEPIYEGEHAGHMVKFFEKENQLMTAAGIWDQWLNKETGEVVESFSIITDEPPAFIDEMGHDRCPVFLTNKAFSAWTQPEKCAPDQLKAILNDCRAELTFDVENDRPMRPGWEKRK